MTLIVRNGEHANYFMCLDIFERFYTWKELKSFAEYRSENNFIGTLKIMNKAAKNFDTLTTNFNILF